MSSPRTFNGSTPAEAASVTINQTIYQVGGGTGVISVYRDSSFSGTLLTLPYTPVAGYEIMVFVNGVLQSNTTDYSISGADITFVATLSTDDVQVRYATDGVTLSSSVQVYGYSEVVTGTSVTLPATPSATFPTAVYVNGVLQVETTHYTISGAVITFLSSLSSDTVQVFYSIG